MRPSDKPSHNAKNCGDCERAGDNLRFDHRQGAHTYYGAGAWGRCNNWQDCAACLEAFAPVFPVDYKKSARV